jgi:hypothetical protein
VGTIVLLHKSLQVQSCCLWVADEHSGRHHTCRGLVSRAGTMVLRHGIVPPAALPPLISMLCVV